ncbi:MAG: hypothetical protein KAR83_07590 [Thermodesulfovibrionales bacterium]|nr:hypothetical protein [Thermodesulfovibrionales bacterium]
MHTLFDFVTYVKGIEYVIALGSIAGYIIFWEILKPRPFKTLLDTGRDDMDGIRKAGREGNKRTIKNLISAPFVGAFYLAMVPIVFAYAASVRVFGEHASFGWRPVEAYLAGRKNRKKNPAQDKD